MSTFVVDIAAPPLVLLGLRVDLDRYVVPLHIETKLSTSE
jgi:hypothetical protein